MRVSDALLFATGAHGDQRRKYTGEPYIIHPIEVMMLVRQYGGDETMQIAALLHDVVEDTNVEPWQIETSFGVRVRALVDQLTEPAHLGNRATRKAAEAARLGQVSADAQTIKCADLISNTRSIVERDPNFAKVYLREKRDMLLRMYRARRDIWWVAWQMLPVL